MLALTLMLVSYCDCTPLRLPLMLPLHNRKRFFFASLIIAERNNCMNGNCEMRYIFQFSFSWWVSSMFAMFVVRCGKEDADQVGRETIFSAVSIMHIMQLIDLNSWYDIRWMTHIGAVFLHIFLYKFNLVNGNIEWLYYFSADRRHQERFVIFFVGFRNLSPVCYECCDGNCKI